MRRSLAIAAAIVGGGLAAVAFGWLGWAWYESRLPATYSVMDYAIPDEGGGAPMEMGKGMSHTHGETSVADLRGPVGAPQRRFTLTAEQGLVRLASGRTVAALSFNGTRARSGAARARRRPCRSDAPEQGRLRTASRSTGTGSTSANGEDGVAGVTQDAVLPARATPIASGPPRSAPSGTTRTRPRPPRSSRGLYGALVIEPADRAAARLADLTLAVHTLQRHAALVNSTRRRRTARRDRRDAGAPAPDQHRQRTASLRPRRHAVRGGRDRRDRSRRPDPTRRAGRSSSQQAAATTSPSRCRLRPVMLAMEDTLVGLALSCDGTARPAGSRRGGEFDPPPTASRRRRPSTPRAISTVCSSSRSGRKPGFFDGSPGLQWSINGGIFPRVADVHGRRRATSFASRSEQRRVRSTRCTCTDTTCSCSAVTASRCRAAPGGRHAQRAAARALRGRLPRGQPRHLDGSLPQPEPRCGRVDDARRLHRE